MNVYDFDGTIYDGDSTVDFYLYCIRESPRLVTSLPGNSLDALRFLAHGLSSLEFKERFLGRILPQISAEEMVAGFWSTHTGKIKEWYREVQRPDDVVISASPTFLLRPICDELGVELIATEMDARTGAISGNNMRGEEKVRGFRERYGTITPDAFYTDTMSDSPMASISRTAYIVKGSKMKAFPQRA